MQPITTETALTFNAHSTACTTHAASDHSVVKKHFYYWDHSNKGYITPIDAFQGCTELGYSTFYSVLLGTMMCMFFSYATQDAWIPDPFFRVRLSPLVNTEAYSKFESNGQFDRDTFESLFMAHAKSDPLGQTITMKEFITMMRSAKSHGMTWKTPLYEWCTLYIFAGHHGSLRKQDVMAAYNGTLFFRVRDTRRLVTNQTTSSGSVHSPSLIHYPPQSLVHSITGRISSLAKRLEENFHALVTKSEQNPPSRSLVWTSHTTSKKTPPCEVELSDTSSVVASSSSSLSQPLLAGLLQPSKEEEGEEEKKYKAIEWDHKSPLTGVKRSERKRSMVEGVQLDLMPSLTGIRRSSTLHPTMPLEETESSSLYIPWLETQSDIGLSTQPSEPAKETTVQLISHLTGVPYYEIQGTHPIENTPLFNLDLLAVPPYTTEDGIDQQETDYDRETLHQRHIMAHLGSYLTGVCYSNTATTPSWYGMGNDQTSLLSTELLSLTETQRPPTSTEIHRHHSISSELISADNSYYDISAVFAGLLHPDTGKHASSLLGVSSVDTLFNRGTVEHEEETETSYVSSSDDVMDHGCFTDPILYCGLQSPPPLVSSVDLTMEFTGGHEGLLPIDVISAVPLTGLSSSPPQQDTFCLMDLDMDLSQCISTESSEEVTETVLFKGLLKKKGSDSSVSALVDSSLLGGGMEYQQNRGRASTSASEREVDQMTVDATKDLLHSYPLPTLGIGKDDTANTKKESKRTYKKKNVETDEPSISIEKDLTDTANAKKESKRAYKKKTVEHSMANDSSEETLPDTTSTKRMYRKKSLETSSLINSAEETTSDAINDSANAKETLKKRTTETSVAGGSSEQTTPDTANATTSKKMSKKKSLETGLAGDTTGETTSDAISTKKNKKKNVETPVVVSDAIEENDVDTFNIKKLSKKQYKKKTSDSSVASDPVEESPENTADLKPSTKKQSTKKNPRTSVASGSIVDQTTDTEAATWQ